LCRPLGLPSGADAWEASRKQMQLRQEMPLRPFELSVQGKKMEVTISHIDLFVKLIEVGIKCCMYIDIYWARNGSYPMTQLNIITKLCHIVDKIREC
jgi:hypothetical protein